MKMNKHLIQASAAAGLLLLAGCHKQENVAPTPDKELQSSVDISYANRVISDIDMVCSFVGENDISPKFYMDDGSNVSVNRDPTNNYLFVTFNNALCKDGHRREGTIAMYYGYTNPNAKYYRDFEFQGRIDLLSYKVDGWAVSLNNSFIVSNKLASPAYDPKTTNLSWSLNGDFTLKHPSDVSKNMRCNVDLVKTLANTSDPAVFAPSKQNMINWPLAVVQYKGKVFGQTSGTVPFTYTIDDANPLVRDFSCYPDKVSGITTSTAGVTSQLRESHPFTKGQATFKTDDLYPRTISYGNEQSTYGDLNNSAGKTLPSQCDNKGIVTIKGISYAVDFTDAYAN